MKEITSDEVAYLLVELYSEYTRLAGKGDDDYAQAVGMAIRMLSD